MDRYACRACDHEFDVADEIAARDIRCPQCGATPSALEETLALEADTRRRPAQRGGPSLKAGLAIGGYRIIREIARGGMGIVYLASQEALGRHVALKVLSPEFSEDPDFVRRFEREARALANLSHPNIVSVIDRGHQDDVYYFVMEYVDGVSLRDVLNEHKLQPLEALRIIPEICGALEYAHGLGIVHRDIKPENILLDKSGRVKITDFGLSKLCRGDDPMGRITKTHTVMGTLDYMAPEQREQSHKVDHRADIYSLGVVFYEMLTGELPIGKFELPSRMNKEVTIDLDKVVLKVLEKDPERRYQRASFVATDVERAGASKGKRRFQTGAKAWEETSFFEDLTNFYPWFKRRIRERNKMGLFGVIVAFMVLGLFGMVWVWAVVPWLVLALIISIFKEDKRPETTDELAKEEDRTRVVNAAAGAPIDFDAGAAPASAETPDSRVRRLQEASCRIRERLSDLHERIKQHHGPVGRKLQKVAAKLEKADRKLQEKIVRLRDRKGFSVGPVHVRVECKGDGGERAQVAPECCEPVSAAAPSRVEKAKTQLAREGKPSKIAWLIGILGALSLFWYTFVLAVGAATFAAWPPLRELLHGGLVAFPVALRDAVSAPLSILGAALLAPTILGCIGIAISKKFLVWGGAKRSRLVHFSWLFLWTWFLIAGALLTHLAIDPFDKHPHDLFDWERRAAALESRVDSVRLDARRDLEDAMFLRAGLKPNRLLGEEIPGLQWAVGLRAAHVLADSGDYTWQDLKRHVQATPQALGRLGSDPNTTRILTENRKRAIELTDVFAAGPEDRADAFATLCAVFGDRETDQSVRRAAFESANRLARWEDRDSPMRADAVELCVLALEDDDRDLRVEAFQQLCWRWGSHARFNRYGDLFEVPYEGRLGPRDFSADADRNRFHAAVSAWRVFAVAEKDFSQCLIMTASSDPAEARAACILIAGRYGARDDLDAAEALIEGLRHSDVEVRRAAIDSLENLFGSKRRFSPDASFDDREEALGTWMRWLEEKRMQKWSKSKRSQPRESE